MAPRSCIIRQSFWINISADFTGELDELVGAQGPTKRSNIGSNEALTPPKASILLLVPSPTKDLFTKFMKMFIEMTKTQAWDREQLEPQKHPLKARTSDTYSGKSHIDYYHFYQ